MPICTLASVQHGVLSGHICGLKLVINDGSEKGYFVNSKVENYLAELSQLTGLVSS